MQYMQKNILSPNKIERLINVHLFAGAKCGHDGTQSNGRATVLYKTVMFHCSSMQPICNLYQLLETAFLNDHCNRKSNIDCLNNTGYIIADTDTCQKAYWKICKKGMNKKYKAPIIALFLVNIKAVINGSTVPNLKRRANKRLDNIPLGHNENNS